MDARAKLVRDILYSSSQFIVPFFQRHYSWRNEHWSRLWGDVQNLLEEPLSSLHFLGPLVCTALNRMPGEVSAYQLIDGQQRLMTVSLMLAATRELAMVYGQQELADEILEEYLIHKRRRDLQRYKVVPRFADRDTFISLLEGQMPDENRSRVVNAFGYFKREIAQYIADDPPRRLNDVFQAVSSRLSLVVITLEGENAYEIFESLNATGLPLEESDLIRNYIFMQIPVEDQASFNDRVWVPFEKLLEGREKDTELDPTALYRDYLMRDGVYSRQKKTYEDFKAQNTARKLAPEDQVVELQRFAQLARMIRFPSEAPTPLRVRLQRVRMLDTSTANCLLLALLDRHRPGEISDSELGRILDDLISFLLRRSVCGESTRPYARWFPEAIRSMGDAPRNNLAAYWARRGWPDDKSFVEGLVDFPLYRRERQKADLILQAIEAAYGHKEKVDLSTLTIEHVMPQSIRRDRNGRTWIEMLGDGWEAIHEQWLHALGNLTLSGYNTPLGNKSFTKKREMLESSNLELNRQLARCQRWTEAEIEERSRRMAEQCAALWPRPPELEKYRPAPEAEEQTLDRVKRGDIRSDYWAGLLNVLREAGVFESLPEPSRQGYLMFNVGWKNARLFAYLDAWTPALGVYVRCNNISRYDLWQRLVEARDRLQHELQMPFKCEEHGDTNKAWMVATIPGHSYVKQGDWSQQHALQADLLTRVYAALRPFFPERPASASGGNVSDRKTRTEIPTETGTRALSANRQLQLEFWQGFHAFARKRSATIIPQKPAPVHWMSISIGTSRAHTNALMNLRERNIGVQLVLRGETRLEDFRRLDAERASVERDIGESLVWAELPERKTSYVTLRKAESDPSVRENWQAQHEFLLTTLEAFRRAFGTRLQSFNAI